MVLIMSKMGRAVLWVQERGLQDDPKALSKYINYLETMKKIRNLSTETTGSYHKMNATQQKIVHKKMNSPANKGKK
jgi:hypothetical protein